MDAMAARSPGRDAVLDELRRAEFGRLDELGQVYLDYTGSGLYAASQVRRHAEMLLGVVLGNPHSGSPASRASTAMVEDARRRVLDFFRADPGEYVAIFTANASHALKLVGEAYPFGRDRRFLLTYDNHNSVNGIREYARGRGSSTTYVPITLPDLRVDEGELVRHLDTAPGGLLAYPAQSNFSGVQHPLEWVPLARKRGWDVLVDAAAFVPTNPLDLSLWRPDFAVMSFYKMFGYPTGLGALIARRAALARLHRPWFAGGTINVASVQADRFVLASGAPGFEDGTPDFTSIPAITQGLALLQSVGVDRIHRRVAWLTASLLDRLLPLRHRSGLPLVRLYGPRTLERRGGALAFNLVDAAGAVVDHDAVERRAAEHRISLRTGCFCNPGAGEIALGLGRHELVSCFEGGGPGMTHDDLRRCVEPKAGGALRVSLGIASSEGDVHAFLDFVRTFLDDGEAHEQTR